MLQKLLKKSLFSFGCDRTKINQTTSYSAECILSRIRTQQL